MAKFILGFNNPGDEFLTEYPDKKTASYQSEEWCEVEADTLEEAKEKYEETYLVLGKQPVQVKTTPGTLPEVIGLNWPRLNDETVCMVIDDENSGEIMVRLEETTDESEKEFEKMFLAELIRRYNSFHRLLQKSTEFLGAMKKRYGKDDVTGQMEYMELEAAIILVTK